jgi:hypothetical protein
MADETKHPEFISVIDVGREFGKDRTTMLALFSKYRGQRGGVTHVIRDIQTTTFPGDRKAYITWEDYEWLKWAEKQPMFVLLDPEKRREAGEPSSGEPELLPV